MHEAKQRRLIEPYAVQDTYVSGLAEVEDIGGGNYRFTFFCREHHDDHEEWTVVAKLIAPLEAVPPAVIKTARAVGMSLALEFPRGTIRH